MSEDINKIKPRTKSEKLKRYQDALRRMKVKSGLTHKDAQKYFTRYRKRIRLYEKKVSKAKEHGKLYWIQKYNDEITQQRFREGIYSEPDTNYFEGNSPT